MTSGSDQSEANRKRRDGRYRKIEVRTWGDEKFRGLSPMPPCGQGLWLYLLTGPHTGPIPGLFRAGRAALAEELGWSTKDFDKAFSEISAKNMVKADFVARLVWIPNAIKHNRPESPNVIKGWRTEFDLLPESSLKYEALGLLKAFVEGMSEAFRKAFHETFREALSHVSYKALRKPSAGSSSKAIGNQEQEQEQELRPTRERIYGKDTGLAGYSSDPGGDPSSEPVDEWAGADDEEFR